MESLGLMEATEDGAETARMGAAGRRVTPVVLARTS